MGKLCLIYLKPVPLYKKNITIFAWFNVGGMFYIWLEGRQKVETEINCDLRQYKECVVEW